MQSVNHRRRTYVGYRTKLGPCVRHPSGKRWPSTDPRRKGIATFDNLMSFKPSLAAAPLAPRHDMRDPYEDRGYESPRTNGAATSVGTAAHWSQGVEMAMPPLAEVEM